MERVLLPKNVKPTIYNIDLIPNLETLKFEGTSTIQLEINQNTKTIELNALDLKITAGYAVIDDKSGKVKQINSSNINLNAERESVVVELVEEIVKGTVGVSLVLKYEGEINGNLVGFYRSKYECNGKSHWLATTQFEPCDARRAFPCWDEPSIKSRFKISITAPKDLTCLSNMPEKSVKLMDDGNLKVVEFDITPVMSTYLVAYCVGHFECVETTTAEGIKFRVWTVPGKKELGTFALEVGAKTLSYFTSYYGIEYPLPKQDMIAVPDFSFGAMENWGLITYRETALLCDASSSFVAKSRVAYVVGHELAHQWFGNLVTMEWWKELWLNEGFATFMGTKAVHSLFPQWSVWTKFLSDHVFRALRADSLRSSHPIEVDISVARKVDEIFDAISYAKGASVILMIEAALGEVGFKKGLNIYLNRFKYGNAVTNDLWQALSEGSGKEVSAIMKPWVTEMGFPVVSVEETNEKGKFKISQNRYLAAGNVTPDENKTIWPILIGVSTQSHPEVKFIEFNQRSTEITIPVNTETEWVKFNAGQTGLYRVRYSPGLLKKLGDNLANLTPRDRAGLQNDAFALAISGDISITQYLSFLFNFVDETNDTVWTDIFTNLSVIRKLFSSDHLDRFILKLVSKLGNTLGWDVKSGEDESISSLRGSVISILGSCGDKDVLEESKKRWTKFITDKNSLPADLQGSVFSLVVISGGEQEFNQMIEVYKSATLPAQKTTALRCIGCSRNVDLIKKGINYMMSEEVRMQDRFILLSSLTASKDGREISWEYVKNSWKEFEAKFSHNLLPRVISLTCENFNTLEKAKEVKDFFSVHKVEGTERTIAQTVEAIESNAAIIKRNADEVAKYLQQY